MLNCGDARHDAMQELLLGGALVRVLQDMTDLLNFDPITLIVVLGGFIATWATLRGDSRWHTEWIKKHSKECDEQRKANNEILTELRASNTHLVTLTTTHHERMGKIDDEIIRLRDRQHDLGNA